MHSTLAYFFTLLCQSGSLPICNYGKDLWFLTFSGSNAYVHRVDLRMAFDLIMYYIRNAMLGLDKSVTGCHATTSNLEKTSVGV
jgi:hypothetical protein